MFEKQLEIRGISQNEIIKYLIQLGAIANDEAKNHYHGQGWSSIVSEEESFRMFQSDIPKVSIVFFSTDEDTLNDVITKFRKKTFRAGG